MGEFNNLQENEAISTSDVRVSDASFQVINLGSGDGLNEALEALENLTLDSVAGTSWEAITDKPTTVAGYGITDAIDGTGTAGKLPKFSDANTLADSKFVDNGTTQALNTSPDGNTQFTINTSLGIGCVVATSYEGSDEPIGFVGQANGNTTGARNIGVYGYSIGNPTKNIGTVGEASQTDAVNVGLLGVASGGSGNYAAQFTDGTEATGKYFRSMTSDGRGQWANIAASEVTGALNANGSVALSANWNAGSYTITSNSFSSGADSVINGVNVGKGAGSGNTLNTRLGVDALKSNTTGFHNTSLGYQTSYSNLTGSYNTNLGYKTGYSNVSGSYNTAVGDQALQNNTASNNVGVGHNALFDNTSGTQNTAVGTGSLNWNTDGSGNTATGYKAGETLSDGTTNNTSSTNSVFVGSSTKSGAAGSTNENVFGYGAIGHGSNTTTIGNTQTATTYILGDISLPSVSVTTASISQVKWAPITINGVTYKLLLGN